MRGGDGEVHLPVGTPGPSDGGEHGSLLLPAVPPRGDTLAPAPDVLLVSGDLTKCHKYPPGHHYSRPERRTADRRKILCPR